MKKLLITFTTRLCPACHAPIGIWQSRGGKGARFFACPHCKAQLKSQFNMMRFSITLFSTIAIIRIARNYSKEASVWLAITVVFIMVGSIFGFADLAVAES